MDIILTLTIRQLKYNRKRTVSAVTGIGAATIFLCIVSAFIRSMLKELENLDGITAEELLPIMGAASVIIAVVMAVLVIFIYNILAVSSRERARYLGMLGSVGATPFQRGKMVILEAVILGGTGIIPAMIAGNLAAGIIFSFGAVSWKWNLAVLLCEYLAVFLASLIPAWQSARGNIIELVQNKTDRRNLKHPVIVPKWLAPKWGIEVHFAVKNILFFKRRYLITGAMLALSMVLFLNGYIYVNYLDGAYEIQDRRPKDQADLVICEERRNADWDKFVSDIAAMPEVDEAVCREQINLGGIVLDPSVICEEAKESQLFEMAGSYRNPGEAVDKSGNRKKGYLVNLVLIALDDPAFESYRKKAEIDDIGETGQESAIPVLIEDYMLTGKNGKVQYGHILDIEMQELSVFGDAAHQLICPFPEGNPIEGFEEWNFQVLGVTDQAPQCYDAAQDLTNESNTIRFYTTKRGFERFCETYKITEGNGSERSVAIRLKSSEGSLAENLLCPTTIRFGDTIQRKLKLSVSERSAWTDPKIREALHIRSDEAWNMIGKIVEAGKAYGMADPTLPDISSADSLDYSYNFYAAQVLGELSDPFPLMRHMFLYGALAFIVIISIFQIVKTISSVIQTRQREFAVFLSLGMTKKQIAKMVCLENLICIVFSFAAGLFISLLAAVFMFHAWEKVQPLEISYPFFMIPIELGFLVILVVTAVYLSAKNIRTICFLEIIREQV